jgi:hypothetical protein
VLLLLLLPSSPSTSSSLSSSSSSFTFLFFLINRYPNEYGRWLQTFFIIYLLEMYYEAPMWNLS